MDVYPTRRSCGYEDWVYAATRKNAVTAELDEDNVYLEKGWEFFGFPIPRNGAEAIRNHKYEPASEGTIAHAAGAEGADGRLRHGAELRQRVQGAPADSDRG
jgi:hypothetical protein